MKKFIQDNWFKLAVPSVLFVVLLASVGYYTGIVLPNKHAEEVRIKQQELDILKRQQEFEEQKFKLEQEKKSEELEIMRQQQALEEQKRLDSILAKQKLEQQIILNQKNLENCLSDAETWLYESVEAICPGLKTTGEGRCYSSGGNVMSPTEVRAVFAWMDNKLAELKAECGNKYSN